jgi:glycosyltransferase involved in cell wall biosynthesis
MNIDHLRNQSAQDGISFLEADSRSAAELQPALRLLVITQFYPPDFAATGQLLEELVSHLNRQGVQVDVFTGQPGYAFHAADAPAREQKEGVRVRRSRMAQLFPGRIRGKALNGVVFSLRAGLNLLRASHSKDVVLLTTAPPFLPILGWLANLILGVSYVCIFYDLYPDIAVELGVISHRHWLARMWRGINRQVWLRSQGIIVLSPAMKQRIVDHCPEIESKVTIIHSWADSKRIVPLSKHENWFALKHHLTRPFTVLYSGNMGRCHDMTTILEAAKLLSHDPIQFVFIGGGAQRKVMMAKVQELGIQDNFLFLPYQDRDVLPYSLSACDLSLVSVSAGMEDLIAPSKLYPALSTGRPIAAVCPPRSYLNPLFQEAGCGSTFENGDSEGLAQFIRYLSQDQQMAVSMGRSGRRYALQHFAPDAIAQQYLKVLMRTAS